MNSKINIKNETDRVVINIEGTIGVPEEWQFEKPDQRVATYEKFRETVRSISEIASADIVVNIRSTGGDVNDALLIHDALAGLDAHITTRCYGYTASAATIIAQAASEGARELSANALYLIHNSVCATEGNAAEIEQKADLLRKTDERLAAIYSARADRPKEEFETLMAENSGNGRWLQPEEVIAAGLADRIIDKEPATREDPAGKPDAKPAEKPRTSLARGWKRLIEAIIRPSEKPTEQMPEDRNIFHFEGEVAPRASRSEIERSEAQSRYSATALRPAEDPSFGDQIRSKNEAAYDADAALFRR